MIADRPGFAVMNGKVVPFTEARISIMAPGMTFAVAVFEGLRAYWNETDQELNVFRVNTHLDRLQFGVVFRRVGVNP